jgi:L-threonylcarbamoyladenylate synthase
MKNEDLDLAIETIKNGGVIAHLTDTIWGLACDPSNEAAVSKIHQIKNRPDNKSFIILISDPTQLHDYVEKIPELAWDMMDFAEDPLTIVYPKGKNVSKLVLAQDGSLAIRLVKDPDVLTLLKKIKGGLISTSANISGQPSPANLSEISAQILNEVDYVLPSDSKEKRKASKIIKLDLDGTFKLIRA